MIIKSRKFKGMKIKGMKIEPIEINDCGSIKDERLPKEVQEELEGYAYEVATFYEEEQETLIYYSKYDDKWYFYSNVQAYITELLKATNYQCEVLTVNYNGTITSINGELPKNKITISGISKKEEG